MGKYDQPIRLVLPGGRLQKAVCELLSAAGVEVDCRPSEYRPAVSDDRFQVKLLRAANIPRLIEYGAHDLGFTGRDWVTETGADVEVITDTGLLPVRIVAAAPAGSDPFDGPRDRPVVVASEYESITCRYIEARGVDYRYVRTYGSTEVFPPEDADIIVDNVATGRTLQANGLAIVDELMDSTCLMVANRAAMADPVKRDTILELQMMIASVLDARQRVLVDMNVDQSRLDAVVAMLPAMKSPTIQPLYGGKHFAVRAAVLRRDVDRLIPRLRRAGASDLLQTELQRVIA